MADLEGTLRKNLEAVRHRIAQACERSGRPADAVTLVAVTKYVDVATARLLFELGVTQLGESRPQELWKKAAAIPEATWHLVGHLQRNKIERTLPVVRFIHSVDSLRLLEALEAEAMKRNRSVDVLLEFRLSGEASKAGFGIEELPAIVSVLEKVQAISVTGLMTMAALDASDDQARQTFAQLRQIQAELQSALANSPHRLLHLSMGMTSDFEMAIEQGATMVRIGSALFEGLEGVGA